MGREGEREIGANVSTLPEGNAGEGEEIRALLFISVPVSFFFLSFFQINLCTELFYPALVSAAFSLCSST